VLHFVVYFINQCTPIFDLATNFGEVATPFDVTQEHRLEAKTVIGAPKRDEIAGAVIASFLHSNLPGLFCLLLSSLDIFFLVP